MGGAVYVRNQAKQELRGLVDNQLTSISAIEKDYKDTEELLKLIDKRQDPEYEEETTSKQLLKAQVPTQTQFGKPAVLGVEEELNIDIERKMAQKFREVTTELDNTSKTNTKIKNLSSKSPFHKILLPDSTELINDTEKFIDDTKPLMTYLNESTMLGIEMTTMSYDLGLALNEAILRGADETSMNNFNKKLKEIEGMKSKLDKIDITGLEASLQKEHTESIATFDEDMKLFYELQTALEKKDIVLLQKAIQSMLLQGEGGSVSSQISRLSFWQSNDTIQSVSKIKQQWKEFMTDKLQ